MERITGKTIDAGDLTTDTQMRRFADAGLVVNGTSLGMHPNVERTPLADTDTIHSQLVLYDTVFNPLDTLLMRQFRSAGALAFGGLDMLVHQGARSFAIWTGVEPPVDVMKQAVIDRFRA
jgi:shikimate dehydrogenase